MFSVHSNNGSFLKQVKYTFLYPVYFFCCGIVALAKKVHILIFWIEKSETDEVGIAVMLILVSGRQQDQFWPSYWLF
jgi:Kef-type K+ transport system membrane component KefB